MDLWISKGDGSQIDYILVRETWSNSINQVLTVYNTVYSTSSTVGLNHRIVSATVCLSMPQYASVCLSLRVSKRPQTEFIKRVDWQQVISDGSIVLNITQTTLKLRSNNFDALSMFDENVETTFNDIQQPEHLSKRRLPY